MHHENTYLRIKTKGFALVATLSLMILLTVVALGLLSLSAVSLRTVSHGEANAVARANARMALILAIGELQSELGPDRRINANASILYDATVGVEISSAAPGRRHWVGVHDAWNSTSDALRPSSAFRKWLVSGADMLTADPSAPNIVSKPEDVVLWKDSVKDDPDRVAVPRISVNAGASSRHAGSYAWWVGDENSKALVSRMPDDAGNLASARADSQAAPAAGFHLSDALAGTDRSSERLDKLVSHRTLDLVGAGGDVADGSFHDFTVWSMGLLTDVARGGLKRDLSLFLDHPVSKPLAPRLPNALAIYPNGITWEELWLYHNVWRALEPPVPGLASMTGGDITDSHMLMSKPGKGAESVSAFKSDPYSIYKIPNFLRLQWLLSLWARDKAGAAGEYELFWVVDAILTIWNPSDVPIALHPDAYMSYKLWSIPYDLELSDQDGVLARTSFRNATHGSTFNDNHVLTLILGTAQNPYHGRIGGADPVVLMPGEVLLMSNRAEGDPVPYQPTHTGHATLGLKAGWNLGPGTRKPATTSRPVTASSQLSYRAVPNSAKNFNNSIINLGLFYGSDSRREPEDVKYGLTGRYAYGAGDARNYPHIFPTLQGEFPSVSAMTGNGKHPFFLISHQTKSEDHSTAWSRMFNPRSSRMLHADLQPLTLARSPHEIVVDGLSGPQDSRMVQLSVNQINRGMFGGSYWDHARGVDTVIVQSIPREPPLSLGTFQHAIANGNTARMNNVAVSPDMGGLRNPEISHAISNSYALPLIAPEQTGASGYTDHSYQVNRMLWDSWFLSGIVQRQAPHHDVKMAAREVYEYLLADPSVPLPNRLLKPTPGAVSAGADALFEPDGNVKAGAHETSSSKLMVEGAFNVNSTSVEAWKALLGSMDAAFIPVAKGTNSPASAEAHRSVDTPVGALLTAYGSGDGRDSAGFVGADLASAGSPAQWRGYRKLDKYEIDELAKEMVGEIRRRGPFLSMADFINRRLSDDKQLALRGPLQAALDRTVNKELFKANGRVAEAPAGLFAFPQAAELPKSLISPAHVRQADILTATGAKLSARSDTFRIRAYGESTDRSGKVLARAWCEAVVQRLPDYLDPADPPEAAAASPDILPRNVPALASNANKEFGRRIEIGSFNWLPAKESP